MFDKTKLAWLGTMLLVGASAPALAADLYEPQVIEAPQVEVYQPVETNGWYIRGDIDYHWSNLRGTEYITYGPPPGTSDFATAKLGGAWSLGAGVGYQVTRHFRTDLTFDYLFKSQFRGSTVGFCPGPCVSSDITAYRAFLLMANAYADLGTYRGFTPYVGGGIGGAHLKWDDLRNTIGGTTTVHRGARGWRFAYALMAGVSYCLTKNVDFDIGYRFAHINGGRMFEFAPDAGPGFDHGINTHEVRAGLRYRFGPNNAEGCGEQMVAYEPPAPAPVYK